MLQFCPYVFSDYEHLVVQEYNGKYKDATKLSLSCSGQNMTATDITFVKIGTAVSKPFHNSVFKWIEICTSGRCKAIEINQTRRQFTSFLFVLRVSIPLLYLQYGPLA